MVDASAGFENLFFRNFQPGEAGLEIDHFSAAKPRFVPLSNAGARLHQAHKVANLASPTLVQS